MRVLLIGAFPFPHHQGSQLYAADQARALKAAGADVTFLSYGHGAGAPPEDIRCLRSAPRLAPRDFRSGFSAAKPLSDLALVAAVVRAQREYRFDIAFAHNAEAAFVAAAARALGGPPFVYVAHTLLREELSAYLAAGQGEQAGRTQASNRLGSALDRRATRSADATLALSEFAAAALAEHTRGPLEVIPPGLTPGPPPSAEELRAACAGLGIEPEAFHLYSGNLDTYQDLELLGEAQRERGGHSAKPPILVATHDARKQAWTPEGLRIVEVSDFAQMRALCFAAKTLLLPRRRRGGFPIKLLNYMEAARPVVAYGEVACGLKHRESAWLLESGDGARAWAKALWELEDHASLQLRLARGARRQLSEAHDWPTLARRTLHLAESVLLGERVAPPS